MTGLIGTTMNQPSYVNASITGRGGKAFQTDAEGWRLDASGNRTGLRIDGTGNVFNKGVQDGYVDSSGSVVGGTRDFEATTRDVNAPTETVAGQLESLLSSGSPYLEQARTGAAQTANARGLLNTSMAAGAGEAAAIDRALPIATADATTYGTAARENQGYTNTAGQFNAAAKNTSNLSAQQAAQQEGLIGAQAKHTSNLSAQEAKQQTGLINTQAKNTSNLSAQEATQQAGLIGTQADAQARLQKQASNLKIKELAAAGQQDLALQELKGQQGVELANIEAQYKGLMQASASAATVFTQVQKNISDILNDPNTSVAQKQAAIDNQTAMLKNSMTVIGASGNVDLAGLLDFGGSVAKPDKDEEEDEKLKAGYEWAVDANGERYQRPVATDDEQGWTD